MTETYPSKRARWLGQAELLPPELQQRIPLRNISAVTTMPYQAQMTLAKALDAGIKRIPPAIRLLKTNPAATVAEVLQTRRRSKRVRQPDLTDLAAHLQAVIADIQNHPQKEQQAAKFCDLLIRSVDALTQSVLSTPSQQSPDGKPS